jgi:ribonuclease HII
MATILGLDEAGRGCVLGPLVVGGFFFHMEDDTPISETGATDSKMLSAKKREAIRPKLQKIGEAKIVEVSAIEIDKGNLNRLEEVTFITIIRHFQPDIVYIDSPTHPSGIPALTQRLKKALEDLPKMPRFIIEPKADLNYPVVGAASIFAKVHRDEQIKALGDVGSGYPSDPKTRRWLKGFLDRNEDFPPCVRTRWGTIEKLKQQSLF